MKRTLTILDKSIDIFSIIMTIGIVILVTLQVLFRFVFKIPAPWTEEIARYMFIYLTFVGSALAVRHGEHIVIDLLLNKFPRLVKLITVMIVQTLTIFFLSIVGIGSWQMVEASVNVSTASLTWLSMSYVYFAPFLGSVLMIFYSLVKTIDIIVSYIRKQDFDKAVTQNPVNL